ncbi:helix-turn-helix domain-containing protein [Agriterribacter humi]|jgi:AraC-like DNA-binding protein|uniref:helix-turn-helix domain-containing protein n=1 Tax=Agriterribacter humi TaxID=1104781 RepID=UPI00126511CA|nr:AraC family transcriptional regulator [Agriterribacter humi]
MINVQDFIGNNNLFKKFKIDELLFVEIICPVETDEPAERLWWHDNFFTYVFSGEMELKTLRGEYRVKAGDCGFIKKGSIMGYRHIIQEDFCELRVFVSDDFIKNVFQKYRVPLVTSEFKGKTDTIIPITTDAVLDAYFHSLLTYFRQPTPPSETLLKLKFEELLVNILSNNTHRTLKCFLSELCTSAKPSIKEIMEANFFNNLSLNEFSRLCARSLSAFKQEFKSIFQTTPGKWLQEKRLEYSRYLLETTDCSIDEICEMSGFENRSHFNRSFKNKYGLTPGKTSQHLF